MLCHSSNYLYFWKIYIFVFNVKFPRIRYILPHRNSPNGDYLNFPRFKLFCALFYRLQFKVHHSAIIRVNFMYIWVIVKWKAQNVLIAAFWNNHSKIVLQNYVLVIDVAAMIFITCWFHLILIFLRHYFHPFFCFQMQGWRWFLRCDNGNEFGIYSWTSLQVVEVSTIKIPGYEGK